MGKIADALRSAILKSGISQYKIAQQAKISQGTLSKFMSKKHDITIETMERIAEVVGIRIDQKPKK